MNKIGYTCVLLWNVLDKVFEVYAKYLIYIEKEWLAQAIFKATQLIHATAEFEAWFRLRRPRRLSRRPALSSHLNEPLSYSYDQYK